MMSTRREFMAAGAAALASAQETRRPNIIYAFADQLRYQSCGYAGDENAYTPNIDQLASESLSLRQAISSSPVCAPYRASLMTGKYQSSTGMVINELRLSPEHACLGHALTGAGYSTSYIGKWHLWANELGHHDETKNGFVPPGPYRMGFDGEWAAYNFNHTYYKAPYFRDQPKREIHPGYEPDSQTDMAIDFLKRQDKAKPFALFLSWGTPHDPWGWNNTPTGEFLARFKEKQIPLRPNYREAPNEYADNWGRPPANYAKEVHQFQQSYYAMTANLDWNLGRLMKALDESGQASNTIVVFTSDHGEMFGSHGRRAKNIFYEEAARVPFLVRHPGRTKAGKASDVLLGTPDIMPTLLGLAGVPVPNGPEGMDLSREILGKGGRTPDAAFMQGMGTTAAWRDGHEWRAMRDRRYTYAVYRRDQSELLFDNQRDPYQMKNLAGERSQRALLEKYRSRLTAWRKEMNDEFHPCTWYEKAWTEDRNIMRGARGGTHNLDRLRQIVSATSA